MDFVQRAGVEAPVIVAFLAVVCMILGLAVGLRDLDTSRSERSRKSAKRWGLSIMGASFTVAAVSMSIAQGYSDEWQGKFDTEVREAYGIELTNNEVRAIDYPESEPTSDFEVFGSFERDGEDVHLVWTGGQLELGSLSAGAFQPLTK